MSGPPDPPLGLLITRSARTLDRAFDAALAEVGGSTPVWLTLLAVQTGRGQNQRELAAVIGIRGATLTHHLNAMERAGLLVRRRDPDNRRVHRVELTESGGELFLACREAAVAFDRALRQLVDPERLSIFVDVLDQLRRNVAPESERPRGPFAPG